MNSINPYMNVGVNPANNTTFTSDSETAKTEKTDLSREEIITTSDLTPEQKLEKLGIKQMSVKELAENLTDKIINKDN